MVMQPRRKTNHTHKEKPMQEQTMTIPTELINEWRLEDMNKQEYNPKVEV